MKKAQKMTKWKYVVKSFYQLLKTASECHVLMTTLEIPSNILKSTILILDEISDQFNDIFFIIHVYTGCAYYFVSIIVVLILYHMIFFAFQVIG